MNDTTDTAPLTPEPNEAKAQHAVLTATVQIKRKDTGKVETYTLTGTTQPPNDEAR